MSHFLAEFKNKKNQSTKARPTVRNHEHSSPSQQQLSSKVMYDTMSSFRASPPKKVIKRVLKPSATLASIMQGPILHQQSPKSTAPLLKNVTKNVARTAGGKQLTSAVVIGELCRSFKDPREAIADQKYQSRSLSQVLNL